MIYYKNSKVEKNEIFEEMGLHKLIPQIRKFLEKNHDIKFVDMSFIETLVSEYDNSDLGYISNKNKQKVKSKINHIYNKYGLVDFLNISDTYDKNNKGISDIIVKVKFNKKTLIYKAIIDYESEFEYIFKKYDYFLVGYDDEFFEHKYSLIYAKNDMFEKYILEFIKFGQNKDNFIDKDYLECAIVLLECVSNKIKKNLIFAQSDTPDIIKLVNRLSDKFNDLHESLEILKLGIQLQDRTINFNK